MSGTGILNADMATLARWTRTGFVWWTEELAAMVPPRLARVFSSRPKTVALFDGRGFDLRRGGSVISRTSGAVAVALPSSAVLVRDIRLPALGQADLRRLVALDADRLLPFPPGSALIDLEAGARGPDGTVPVAVAALPLAQAGAAIDAARAAGLIVEQLGVALPGGGVRFDFLPAWRALHGSGSASARRFWWGLVAALFVLNLAVVIGRDVYSLRTTAELVEAHGQTATTARTLRQRVIAEDVRRRALLDRRVRQDPLRILGLATRALPNGAWVQRLAWDGATLRLTGFKNGAIDPVAALRATRAFAAVRAAAGDVSADTATGQPFDLTAEMPGAARKPGAAVAP